MAIVDEVAKLPGLRGPVWRPGDAGYTKSRSIWNMRTADDQPNCIVQAADDNDVIAIMRYCEHSGTPLAVRSGGHGVDATAMPDAALVLDLTAFKAIEYDPATEHVRVGSGVLLGEIDGAMEAHGRVVPAGTVSTTGLAGLVLGGGLGFNSRRFGASVDNLVACDIVTTSGHKIRASAQENEDLFWALRGGGGNFGVVTTFEFQSRPIPALVSAAFLCFPLEQAPQVLAAMEDFMQSAPRELTLVGALTQCPPFPDVPEKYHAANILIVTMVYTGADDQAESLIKTITGMGTPLAVMRIVDSWSKINSMLDPTAPSGRKFFTRGGYLSALGKSVIDTAIENSVLAPAPTHYPHPSTGQNFISFGGALTEDFDEEATAFSREGANWLWEGVGQWDHPEDDESYEKWTDSALLGVQSALRTNGYINLTLDQGPEWRKKIWGSSEKYEKLVVIKTKFDPQNILRFNKNIPPSGIDQ